MKAMAFLLALSSCKLLVGIKQASEVNATNFKKLCAKHRLKADSNSFYIKKRQFSKLVHSRGIDTANQNYLQPLQLIVFDSNQKQISHLINCNIGGFPKLKWNRRASFDQMPVQQNGLYPSKARFEMPFFTALTGKEYQKGSHQYYYFVIWSSILGYNSKNFLQLIEENIKLDSSKKINIAYINIDNEYIED